MVRLKSRVEREQSARTRTAIASLAGSVAGKSSQRKRAPRCDQSKRRELQEEAIKQVTEAAREIVRANVEKAKAGSLTHTRWLFSLMELLQEEESPENQAQQKSLAEMLIKQLKNKH